MDLDLPTYAAVMAELAATGAERAAVLARHDLDERRWDAIDTEWQQRLSAALDADEDGVPTLISEHAAAYAAAQRALAPSISLEQLAQVTRLLAASGDLRASLAKVGVALDAYLRGSEHWTRRIVEDPETERLYREALRSG